MKASNRNNRLLLVITLIGAIFGSVSIVSHFINLAFQETYNGRLPVSLLIFVGPIALSIEIVVIIYGVYYAYGEARVYIENQKRKELQKAKESADSRYKLFLSVTKYTVFSWLVIILILAFVMSDSWKVKLVFSTMLLVMLIATIVLFTMEIKKRRQATGRLQNPFRNSTAINNLNLIINHSAFGLLVFFMVMAISIIVTNSEYNQEYFKANITQQPELQMSLINVNATNFTAKVINGNNNINIPINNDVGLYSSRIEYTKSDSTDNYTYVLNVNLRKYLRTGWNRVKISFQYGNTTALKSYTYIDDVFFSTDEIIVANSKVAQRL